MTTDRDIRFSAEEISVTQYALRDEIKRRTRSIDKALVAQAYGQKIQQNVLESHIKARADARAVLENLEVARKQIARRIAEQIGAVAN